MSELAENTAIASDAVLSLEHAGCRLAYRVRGQGMPVLLIQGVGVHGDGWTPQVDALAGQCRCLTFDNRGMGQSQPAGSAITIEQMAEDAVSLLDAQGWPSAHIVGHSLGGLVAQHIGLRYRQHVQSLALLCTFAHGSIATRLTPWKFWTGLRTRFGSRSRRRDAFLQLVMSPDYLAAADRSVLAVRLAALFGHDLADHPAIVKSQLAALRAYDATPRLHELAGIPTLVISATHDRIAPTFAGRALANAIPGAIYTEIPDAAHGVTIQCAERINAILLNHFLINNQAD